MKQSRLFTKTRKEAPADEVAKNAQLLIRAGYINKEMAGVYSYLPLGLRVLNNIATIIREEMNAVGGHEMLMPSFHPRENWEKTGRWDTMDDLYKVSDASGREVALGPTHEEVVVPLAKQFISSYKDLPFSAYQIQNKFRMEMRAKSGILRGREFLMKDLYSFHVDEADLDAYYDTVKDAYKRIFERVGIGGKTYLTFASGGSFSKYSHEFQAVTDAGEDLIYIDEEKGVAVNKEVLNDEVLSDLGLAREKLVEKKAIEVGNIFKLMTKFSEPFSLTYKDAEGKSIPVIMGCYGIGLGRLMGTIVEVLGDEKGIVWPEAVSPYRVHLVELSGNDTELKDEADGLYNTFKENGVEVLYDDRDVRAGEKFADSDLLGLPYRVVVSKKTKEEGKFEVVERKTGEVSYLTEEELHQKFLNADA